MRNTAEVLAAGDRTLPYAELQWPLNGGTVTGTVGLSAYAVDNIGVDHVDFLARRRRGRQRQNVALPVQLELGRRRPRRRESRPAPSTRPATATPRRSARSPSDNARMQVRKGLALALALLLLGFAAGTAEAARTYVSLTFDDGLLTEYQHNDVLASRDARATFYVNTNKLGVPGYMTREQVERSPTPATRSAATRSTTERCRRWRRASASGRSATTARRCCCAATTRATSPTRTASRTPPRARPSRAAATTPRARPAGSTTPTTAASSPSG